MIAIDSGRNAIPITRSKPVAQGSGLVCFFKRKKKQRLPSVFFGSSFSGVQTGILSGPSGGIPSPSVGSELLFVPALRYALLPEHSSSGFPPAPVCSWSRVSPRRQW